MDEQRKLILDQFTRQAVPFSEMHARDDSEIHQILIRTAGITAEDEVLDVACGPGLVTCEVARVARHATGVDLTPAMIAQAEARQRSLGPTNLTSTLCRCPRLTVRIGGGRTRMTPKDVLLAWVKAFNDRDADALTPLYHPEAINHQVAAGDPAVGRDAIIRDARGFFAAFPDTFTHVEAVYQDGDVVALEWSGGATWLGEFAGHAPTGKTFTIRGCGFFRVKNEQIVHQRGYWDRAGWFLQLGIPVE